MLISMRGQQAIHIKQFISLSRGCRRRHCRNRSTLCSISIDGAAQLAGNRNWLLQFKLNSKWWFRSQKNKKNGNCWRTNCGRPEWGLLWNVTKTEFKINCSIIICCNNPIALLSSVFSLRRIELVFALNSIEQCAGRAHALNGKREYVTTR